MDALEIKGPNHFSGSVSISGSKNTALPLLFASLLFDDPIQFSRIPRLWDIETTLKLLESMGCKSQWDKDSEKVTILPSVKKKEASYEWVKKMRAGILALGPLVAKYGEAKVSLPGGCAIGARPVNYHLEAMKKMGVSIEVKEGYIHATIPNQLKGATILFPEVTVTGTANLLYLAPFAEGETVLENAAEEPEVVALGEFLVRCGAKITGLGTSRIHIKKSELKTPDFIVEVPADRIETGTWLAIAMATRSELKIKNTDASKLTRVIEVFRQTGLGIEVQSDGRALFVTPKDKYDPIEVETSPYPGFPTDMQAQLLTCLCFASGKSRIKETIFENRFMHVAELRRLGAKIEVSDNTAYIEGPVALTGAPLMATDLRASASLVIAALAATGVSRISRIYHLDRGYQRLDGKLRDLGAEITRVAE